MTDIDDETAALLKPLADVGAMLARAVDDLRDEVEQLKRDLRAVERAYDAHIRLHNRGEA